MTNPKCSTTATQPLTSTTETDALNILARLGTGAHGEVLLGERSDGGRVAIKVGLRRLAIDREADVLSAMAGEAGFPKVLHYTPPSDTRDGVLVMELLGPTIESIWQRRLKHAHVSAPMVLRVGRGALRRLRQLHLAGFVHNDVKPANLVFGAPGSEANEVHLIDFGLTSRCGKARKVPKGGATRTRDEPDGTPSFAALAAHHRRRPMCPSDDVEALVYTLAFLAVGSLPWTDQSYSCAVRMKQQMLTDGSGVLTDACPISDLMRDGHCPDVADALRMLWAEVVRGQGRGHGHGRDARIDYEACLAALGGGIEDGVESGWPFVLEGGARGTLLGDGIYRP